MSVTTTIFLFLWDLPLYNSDHYKKLLLSLVLPLYVNDDHNVFLLLRAFLHMSVTTTICFFLYGTLFSYVSDHHNAFLLLWGLPSYVSDHHNVSSFMEPFLHMSVTTTIRFFFYGTFFHMSMITTIRTSVITTIHFLFNWTFLHLTMTTTICFFFT